jgi:hypothetical protein
VLSRYVDSVLRDFFATEMPPPPADDPSSWSDAAQVRWCMHARASGSWFFLEGGGLSPFTQHPFSAQQALNENDVPASALAGNGVSL